MQEAVTYDQVMRIGARGVVASEIVTMLLAQEIARQSPVGRYWIDRAAIAQADLARHDERSVMLADPVAGILREIVAHVDRASGLAPSARTSADPG